MSSYASALALPLLVAASAFVVQEARADENNIKDQIIVVNNQIALDIPYVYGDISGGSAEVIKVVPLRENKQILIAGKRAGSTNVIIYDTKGLRRDEFEVVVIPANLSRVMKSVQELLDDIEGLKYKVVNDRVYIQGEVSLEEDLKRVDDVTIKNKPYVESMVSLSPVSQRLLADLIQKEIGTPGVRVRLVSRKILIEGVVHSRTASARAEAIAKAYYNDVINVLEVREAERIPGHTDTVTIIVHFVQLTKSLLNSWGVQWSPLNYEEGLEFYYYRSYTSAGWGEPSGYASATVNMLLPKLNRAKTSGYARVLENPSVSVKSGEAAHIFSGAKVPFAVQGDNGQVFIQYEKVGVTLDVTPYAQGNDVDMNINIEVSSLGEIAPSGYQMIDTSSITTSEYCRAGESIVIGGLQRLSDRIEYNRIPEGEAGTTQSVFTLYKSKDYKKSKSQFLVFITPKVHESSSQANQELQDKFNLIEVRQ